MRITRKVTGVNIVNVEYVWPDKKENKSKHKKIVKTDFEVAEAQSCSTLWSLHIRGNSYAMWFAYKFPFTVQMSVGVASQKWFNRKNKKIK